VLDSSPAARFLRLSGKSSFAELYQWSIDESEVFWKTVWQFTNIIGDYADPVLQKSDFIGTRFFPNCKINFAENLLWQDDSKEAIVFRDEFLNRRSLTYGDLKNKVSALSRFFKNHEVLPGDVVAACLPNIPETVIAMLATASIGATFSSCSPDFGTKGVLDRFKQLNPKVFITTNGYYWKGKPVSITDKAKDISSSLGSKTLVVKFIEEEISFGSPFEEFLSLSGGLEFTRFPFNHPLYVLFTSGTTGIPKGIIHGAGGHLLELKKELMIHTNVTPDTRIFYQTTCGWMMWNWLVGALSCGCTVILYDGSPLERDGKILWQIAEEEKIEVFGTNAKYLSIIEKLNIKPKEFNLASLKTVLSTGSPLSEESFDYVYREIKDDVLLASISGGTDILGCFALGSPLLPVYRGELQTRSLGLDVGVFDEDGKDIINKKGELVCKSPFPSKPLGFVNDPDNSKFKKAYFERFNGVWHHGDYVLLNERGGMVFYGRSDATLNPGGVRIGTAEIYSAVEVCPEVLECVAIGQNWKNDVRIVLFVVLNTELTDELKKKIANTIKEKCSPFHVPKKIIQVPEIPRTRSGKIVELAIRSVVHGEEITNLEAILNPESLEFFKNIEELNNE
jgi:acetoacetyl-CoA synthetase